LVLNPAVTRKSVFPRDEWLYIAKVFSAWLLGGSLLIALVLTGQFYLAFSQFGGEEYIGRVVALAIPGQKY
jgi:ABC-type transporter Mla maintaining outer membrane lipid asymmetry permease subunit MlaE